jgi:hypothetical protein
MMVLKYGMLGKGRTRMTQIERMKADFFISNTQREKKHFLMQSAQRKLYAEIAELFIGIYIRTAEFLSVCSA